MTKRTLHFLSKASLHNHKVCLIYSSAGRREQGVYCHRKRNVRFRSSSKIEGDAAYHRKLFLNMGYSLVQYDGQEPLEKLCEQCSIIVDAMLGIGVKGEIRSPYREAIQTVNASQAYTISVDLPSGVPADEGVEVNQAVKADRTVVIQYPKLSAYLQHTAPYYINFSHCTKCDPSTGFFCIGSYVYIPPRPKWVYLGCERIGLFL